VSRPASEVWLVWRPFHSTPRLWLAVRAATKVIDELSRPTPDSELEVDARCATVLIRFFDLSDRHLVLPWR
jgi:hypothetical protein